MRLFCNPAVHRGSEKKAPYHFNDHLVVGKLRNREGVNDIRTAIIMGSVK
jgi:hypothetical protein